jgi:hypothetical protein
LHGRIVGIRRSPLAGHAVLLHTATQGAFRPGRFDDFGIFVAYTILSIFSIFLALEMVGKTQSPLASIDIGAAPI